MPGVASQELLEGAPDGEQDGVLCGEEAIPWRTVKGLQLQRSLTIRKLQAKLRQVFAQASRRDWIRPCEV